MDPVDEMATDSRGNVDLVRWAGFRSGFRLLCLLDKVLNFPRDGSNSTTGRQDCGCGLGDEIGHPVLCFGNLGDKKRKD